MTTEIPVDVQVLRAYHHVRELLELRSYDVSNYPELTNDALGENRVGQHIHIPPILTSETEHPTTCFGGESREMNEIVTVLSSSAVSFTTAFQYRYPVLSKLLLHYVDRNETHPGFDKAFPSEITRMYKEFAQRRVEVHFHQCFNPENIWGANSRDKRFLNEMNAMITSMEESSYHLFERYKDKMQEQIPKHIFAQYQVELLQELTSVFKKSYTLIFLYRTRSKASATLDHKYEMYCADILKKHGVFIQLFNAKHLMFNVTKHEIVPTHEALDIWQHHTEIESIKRVYNISNLAKENPAIGLGDPVAKFIGLRRGQLCKITRVNPSSGTYITYRWCK
jgi:DNA-directed RNA polymerase subunit H (RpoH/RPB5)